MSAAAQEPEVLDAYSQAITTAAERAGPAVVKIEIGRQSNQNQARMPGGRFQEGLGSGVIYSSAGHILTNAHVVAGARRVLVTLPDGRKFPAGVLGTEQARDLAVLRVAQDRLPVAELHAAPLRVGQLVVAIGNPFGLDFTVTAGVVSALNRSLPMSANQALEPLIQTDTPINPGNSGGPLVDVHGRVVGITTAIMPFAQGLGFAIPTSTAYDVIGRITELYRRSLSGGVLGISGLEYVLESEVMQQNGLEQRSGVLLLEVAPDSAADRASLRTGDILLALDDQPTSTVEALRKAIEQSKGHSPWRIVFLREGRRRSVSLVPQRAG